MDRIDEEMIDAETWQIRAALCELLALSFRYPDGELVDAIASGEWVEAARELGDAAGMITSEDFAAGLSAGGKAEGDPPADDDALLHALRVEATRLFVGFPEPVVSPYEGVWAALDDGVQPLLFVNPKSMEVERFCHACGLGRPEGTNEPLDHIETEWELMQFLAMAAAGFVDEGEGGPEEGDFPGGSPCAAYEIFFAEHVLTWMPRFAEKVIAEAQHPFYRSAAELLASFVVR